MAGLRSIAPAKTIASAAIGALGTPPPPTTAEGRPNTALDRPTIFPQGPQLLRLGVKKDNTTGGPGLKPTDFDGTQPEWVWYFASARYHNDPLDPFTGPFTGGTQGEWAFADPIGDTQAVRTVGGATPDFIYLTPGGEVIVRVQGFHWHTAANAAQQARDAYNAVQAGTLSHPHRIGGGRRVHGRRDRQQGGAAAGRHPGRRLPHRGHSWRAGRAPSLRAL